MPLFSKTISGLYGGISQQPAALRIDNQSESMSNCFPSLVDGVRKRPPTEFIKVLKSTTTPTTDKFKAHFIDRDTAEEYLVLFTGVAGEPIEVYSLLDGSKKTVTIPGYDGYITTTTPENIKALTLGDHTVIVNTGWTTAMSGEVASDIDYPTAIVFVKHGVAGTDYRVFVNGAQVAVYTSATTTDYNTYKTSTIAASLQTQLITSLGTNWRVECRSSVVLLWKKDATDFEFYVTDSWGDAALVGIKNDARKIEDLPNVLPSFTSVARSTITLSGSCWEYRNGEPIGNLHLTESLILNGTHIDVSTDVLSPTYDTTLDAMAITLATYIAARYSSDPSIQVLVNASTITIWDTDGLVIPNVVNDTINPWWYQSGSMFAMSVENSAADAAGQNSILVHVGGKQNTENNLGYFVGWRDTALTGGGLQHTTGVWKETRQRGLDNTFNPITMPHQLVRNADGTFTFGPIAWGERLVGDLDSAPNPSFIGNTISDVFLFKNRLGFLSAGNVLLSRSDDYWNFYPTSALEMVDDDPIDITVPSTGVDYLRWGVPHRSDLLIFGPTDEYLLTAGDQIFTAKTATLEANTNYPISSLVAPVRCGANIYFVSPKGEFAALHEYYTQPQTLTDDAADVTAHCPRYLPYNIVHLAASSAFNLLLGSTGADAHIYTYKYYWAGEQKAQSAWSRWTLPYTVKALSIIDNAVYILGCTGTRYVLEKMNLDIPDTGVLDFKVRLDQQVLFSTPSSHANFVVTRPIYYMPYAISPGDLSKYHIINPATGAEITGVTIYGTHPTTGGTGLEISGNYETTPVLIGREYEQSFGFSEFGIPAPKANLNTPQGRLQIRTLTVCSGDTDAYSLTVTPKGRTGQTRVYMGNARGRKRFMISSDAHGLSLVLTNTSYHPATWYEASWEGYYTSRSQLI